MPIYEYACAACGGHMEAMQKINDEPLVECPTCHKSALIKLVSAASFRLKGGGWYETDFKTGENKKNILQEDSRESSGSSSGSESGGGGGGKETSDVSGSGSQGEKANKGDSSSVSGKDSGSTGTMTGTTTGTVTGGSSSSSKVD